MGELRRITVRGRVVDENNDDDGFYAVIEQDASSIARTWPLRVCEACLSDRYEVNDSAAKTFVCTDCGHESNTVKTLTVCLAER